MASNDRPHFDISPEIETWISQARNDRARSIMESVIQDSARIKEVMGLEGNGTFLDIGCGGGWIDIGLAMLTDLNFVCADISPRCVKGTKEDVAQFYLGNRFQVLQADVHELPFDDNSFEYALSTSSIGFWHNPQRGIEELYRVLKPGGRIFIRGFDGNRYSDFWKTLLDTEIRPFEVTRRKDMAYISIWKEED